MTIIFLEKYRFIFMSTESMPFKNECVYLFEEKQAIAYQGKGKLLEQARILLTITEL